MNRMECRITAGFLAIVISLAIGLVPMGSPAAENQKSPAVQVRAKSPLSTQAPLLGRIVITPSAEQMAKIRLERRMIGLKGQVAGAHPAGNAHPESTGAL